MRPWLWQKRTIVPTGNCSIWSVGHDQMQPIIGRKYHSRNVLPKPWRSRKAPMGSFSAASAPSTASAVASLLKRTMSASMRRKRGRSRLRRCAKTVLRSQPLHSSPASGTCTENDMSEAAVSTCSSVNSRAQLRVGAVVEDQEAGVDTERVAVQRDVDRVGVAAEVVAGLEQGDLGLAGQRVGAGQAGDARADDGDATHRLQARAPHCAARRDVKTVVQRPAANEGGREEEENRPGIAAGEPGRLHDRRTLPCASALPMSRAVRRVTGIRRQSSGDIAPFVATGQVRGARLGRGFMVCRLVRAAERFG